MSAYAVRSMTREEVDIAVEWAAAEGWNPGLHDAQCFFNTDPGGFLVGLLDDEPVAVISAIRYEPAFAFIGFYIVKPVHRGEGYGINIWRAGMERLEGRNIGLDGVVDQQDNYRKSGFRLAYRNIRYQGRGGVVTDATSLTDLASVAFDDLAAYDRPFFPGERSRFLRCWVEQPGTVGLAASAGGRVQGYGVLRPCRAGWKIGPLFADGPELAESLFAALCARAGEGDPVYLDTPEVNAEALALAERHKMTKVFETARMYTGEVPDLPLDRLYGVTTFELG